MTKAKTPSKIPVYGQLDRFYMITAEKVIVVDSKGKKIASASLEDAYNNALAAGVELNKQVDHTQEVLNAIAAQWDEK